MRASLIWVSWLAGQVKPRYFSVFSVFSVKDCRAGEGKSTFPAFLGHFSQTALGVWVGAV